MGRRAVIFHAGQIDVFSDRQEYWPEAERSRNKRPQDYRETKKWRQHGPGASQCLCDPVSFLHHTSRTVPQLSIIEWLSTWVAWRGSVSYNQWVQTRVQVSLPNPHSVRFRYCTTPAQGLGVPYMGTDLPLLWDHGQLSCSYFTLWCYGRPFSCCGHTWCVQSLVMSLNLRWSHLRCFNLVSARPFLLLWLRAVFWKDVFHVDQGYELLKLKEKPNCWPMNGTNCLFYSLVGLSP